MRTALVATVVLGVGLSLLVWQNVRLATARSVQRAVEEEAAQLTERIAFDLDVRVRSLQRLASRWAFETALPGDVWEADATQFTSTIAGFQTIEVAGADGVVRRVAPPSGSEALLGRQADADPATAEAMAVVRGTGRPEVVAPVGLPHAADGAGILVLLQLRDHDTFQGWLIAAFGVDDLVREAHGAQPGYSVRILHGDNVVYASDGPATGSCQGGPLDPVDPALHLEVCATRELVDATRGPFPLLALGVGLAFTALSSGLVVALDAARARGAEARALADTVQEHARAIERAHRELADLSYAVSHELRTPLRAIDGHAAILQEQASPEARPALARIRQNAQGMARQIDGLLEILRIARATPRSERIDVSRLAHDHLEELRRAQPDRPIEVHVDQPIVVQSDPELVRVLLGALLDNAWKFTRDRTPAHVGVLAEPNGFAVHDDGVGFDMKYASKLFRTFEKLHPPGQFEGLGLGLATAARAAVSLGAHITAESSPGAGATFHVVFGSLPAAHPERDAR